MQNKTQLSIQSVHCFSGEVTLPGDKSISQRAIIFAALANGQSRISHFLESQDCLDTLNVLKALGLIFHWNKQRDLIIEGLGLKGFHAPNAPLYFGNSGTGLRLMAGVLAGQSFDSILIGDASLCKRPMDRIIEPLRQMGAEITGEQYENKTVAPLKIKGNPQLKSIEYYSTIASAQVKSCILLAGALAQGITRVHEPQLSRDHTERMLNLFRSPLGELQACNLTVPSDISSAAFLIVAATLIPGSHLVLKSVGVNPTRLGVIRILKLMGADIELIHYQDEWEPMADIIVRYSPLQGIIIPPEEVVSAIDEFPILFIAAAFAKGETVLRNAQELRVKESDRLSTMAQNLKKLGINLEEYPDGMRIEGMDNRDFNNTNNKIIIDSAADHRIAMAFCIAACIMKYKKYTGVFIVPDIDCIASSFPNFLALMESLGVKYDISK